MKKLTASALLAGALVFGTAAGAEYYNDLETNSGDPIPIVDIRDGIGFVRASQYSMPFFDIELNAEENFVFSRGGDELCITPGSVTALFNGETVTMPGAPYLEDGELYVPIRFLCDTFDIRLAFSDKTYPEKVTLYAGKDVQPMSGLIGDSFNNWSITIPEGWYYYPDSVDGSTATFNTFNGMRVAIAMIDPADPTSPSSTGLEDYLLRREVFTGADGRKYIVQGEIYSHPTAEARAQLNAVIDSFAVGFSDGAHDVSNISEDGTRWEMTSFCPGISFDIPLGWDTYDDWRGGWAGYEYGEGIEVRAKIYADITFEQIIDRVRFTSEYAGIDIDIPQFTEVSYNGYDIITYEGEYPLSYELEFYVEDFGNLYVFTVSTDSYEYDFESLPESFKAKAKESMYMILDSLRLSDPGDDAHDISETELLEPDAEPKDFTVGGLKFTVPGPLVKPAESAGRVIPDGLFVGALSTGSMLMIMSNTEDEAFFSEEDPAEFAEMTETVNINGIEFLKVKDEVFSEDIEPGDAFELYISPNDNVMIWLYIDADTTDTQYAADLRSIVQSAHR